MGQIEGRSACAGMLWTTVWVLQASAASPLRGGSSDAKCAGDGPGKSLTDGDCEAWLKLYDGIGGIDSVIHPNFRNSPCDVGGKTEPLKKSCKSSPCVMCSADHITKIDLHGVHSHPPLRGELPALPKGSFPFLEELRVDNNMLNGTVPAWNLAKLKLCNLYSKTNRFACPLPSWATQPPCSMRVSDCYCAPGFGYNVTGGCTQCRVGQFATGAVIGSAKSSAAGCQNITCPEGQASTMPGASAQFPSASAGCAPCTAGHFSTSGGVMVCSPCPAGKFSAAGAPACLGCPGGKYSNQSSAGAGVCENCACAAGYASVANATSRIGNCTPCSPGQFGTGGNATCANCTCAQGEQCGRVAGHPATTPHTCSSCPEGKVSPGGSGLCHACKCSHGYGCRAGAPQCSLCAAGQFSLGGNATCAVCALGRFAQKPGAKHCSACPAGWFAAVAGSKNCSSCAPGHFSLGGSATCAACASGHFALDKARSCDACPAGKFAAAAKSATCASCPACAYQPEQGQSGCKQCACAPGSGVNVPEGDARYSCFCSPCRQGFASLGGNATCKACAPGMFASNDNQTTCLVCDGVVSVDGKSCNADHKGEGVGSEAGAIVGSVVGAFALAAALLFARKRRAGFGGEKRWAEAGRVSLLEGMDEEGEEVVVEEEKDEEDDDEDDVEDCGLRSLSVSEEEPRRPIPAAVRVFTSAELREATHGFSDDNKLDEGTFGTVHHGKMRDGTRVAVKRLKEISNAEDSRAAVETFRREAEVLGKYRHTNIVALLGYSFVDAAAASLGWLAFSKESGHFLVYELMRGGSLKDRLRPRRDHRGVGGGQGSQGSRNGRSRSKRKGRSRSAITAAPLTWQERFDILSDTARGLEYLHVSTDPPIIHQDVKSANILLGRYGGKLVAKVADFGAARIAPTLVDETHISTVNIVGTRPYMPLEYLQSGHVSEKTDAYALGVVACELLTGRPPSNPKTKEFLALEIMADLNAAVLEPQRMLPRMLDTSAGAWPLDKAATLVRIVRQLLEQNWRKRSAVREVLMELDELAGRQVVRRAQRSEMYDPHTGLLVHSTLVEPSARGPLSPPSARANFASEGTGGWMLAK